MSLSEIFDHGAAHPWANLRVNNLTVDGTLTTPGTGTLTTLVIPMSVPIPIANFTFLFSKIGRDVTVNLPDIQSGALGGVAGNPITSGPGAIPANLLPDYSNGATQYFWVVRTIDAGVIQAGGGLIQILPNGTISVFATQQGGGFGNTGQRGSFSITISYRSAI